MIVRSIFVHRYENRALLASRVNVDSSAEYSTSGHTEDTQNVDPREHRAFEGGAEPYAAVNQHPVLRGAERTSSRIILWTSESATSIEAPKETEKFPRLWELSVQVHRPVASVLQPGGPRNLLCAP